MRQLFGYERLGQPQLLEPMNDLHKSEWPLRQNSFCPAFKLEKKERINSKYRRIYQKPQTPYQRPIASPDLSLQAIRSLRKTFRSLDPFDLKKGD